MIHLPNWLKEAFTKQACYKCKAALDKKGVTAIGISEEKQKKQKKATLSIFYEYHCPHCKSRATFTGFQTDWDDFISDMVDVARASNSPETPDELPQAEADDEVAEAPAETAPKTKRKGMSNVEIQDVMKDLNESADLKDFFTKLGIVFENKRNDEESK